MGGDSPKYPGPTAEETTLQRDQTELLKLQQEILRRGVAEQQAISPYLYRQLGLTPQYDAAGRLTGFTEDPQFQQIMNLSRQYQLGQAEFAPEQLAATREQLAATRGLLPLQTDTLRSQLGLQGEQYEAQRGLLPLQTDTLRSQFGLQQEQNEFARRQQQRQELMQPDSYREMGLREVRDAQGNVTGFEQLPDELRDQGREIQRLQQERSLAALRGELPQDPALLRDLQEREALTRESLRRQLGGGGYATSTAGSEALGRFEEARAMTLDAARRNDLTMAESLGLARQQGNLARDQYRTGLMGSVRPTPFLQQPSLSGALGGTGGLAGLGALGGGGAGAGGGFAGLAALSGLPGQSSNLSGGFGDVFGGYNQIMGQLGQWRGNQFQANVSKSQQQQAENQMYGQIGGTVASTAAVVAAMAGGSSRSLKRDITALRPEDEEQTLGELMGDA